MGARTSLQLQETFRELDAFLPRYITHVQDFKRDEHALHIALSSYGKKIADNLIREEKRHLDDLNHYAQKHGLDIQAKYTLTTLVCGHLRPSVNAQFDHLLGVDAATDDKLRKFFTDWLSSATNGEHSIGDSMINEVLQWADKTTTR